MLEITRVVAADGTVSFTTAEKSYLETAITVATSPLAMLSNSEVYINKQVMGLGTTAALCGGIVLGDMFGAKIPLLGGRRGY